MDKALNIDNNLCFLNIPLYCDNISASNLTKNPVLHSRTKHIEIRDHFIRDHVQKGHIEVKFVRSEEQLGDILTKPLLEERYYHLRKEIGMVCSSNVV